MGSWSVSCGVSNLAITAGQKVVLLPLKLVNDWDIDKYYPATLPLFGEYDDYGGIEELQKDENTALIEKHFGISIDQFAEFLLNGKYTYDRDEAKAIAENFEAAEIGDDVKNWRFMWIDRQVYDFMVVNLNDYEKGYNDYGTPEMLKRFGFKFVEKRDTFDNYDPKRFNQLWKKGNLKMFSDGTTLLKNNRYIYHYGKGDETSIETYFQVPKEMEYLKDLHAHEAWRDAALNSRKGHLSYIIGIQDYERDLLFAKLYDSMGKENPYAKPPTLAGLYLSNLEKFGDMLAQLINMRQNMRAMSGSFRPHTLYLTPQCGDYETHQKLLEKFCEINKSYIREEEE